MKPLRERHVVFECAGETCVGVLAERLDATPKAALLIVVGGPQTRVGSHRQFVHLARAVAREGVPVLRFDYRGMGDSSGERRTFEAIDEDLRAGVEVLCRETGVREVMLWGLCDGATASLMYAPTDARVRGVVAVNPWARTPDVEAASRLRHYYLQRLLSRAFWSKLFSGRFRLRESSRDLSSAVRAAGRKPQADFLARMDDGWAAFQGPLLFVLSGRDYTAREFETWVAREPRRVRRLQQQGTRVVRIDDADHTFSSQPQADRLADATVAWIRARA